ncbi:MAG: DUF3300 domain-containing protein [Casimicrobiaceae bacterium]
MIRRTQRWTVLLLALVALAPAGLYAQTAPPPDLQSAPAAQLPQDQLDALLAPIALYPDQLLSQILIASTYPLDVVEAARFVQQNPGLRGDALNQALDGRSWDPSVLSLAAFPQVLAMMNDKLDWTQQLGDAFLANEAQVMATAQSLRARAQAQGNLQSTEQQKVYVQEKTIIIEPAQPQYVYVPVYNPTVIYGTWWSPSYRPWYWYPPAVYGYPPIGAAIGVGFVWGTAWAISGNHWGWANPNWRGGNININVNNNYFFNRPGYNNRYQNGNWQHNPQQRRGVAYRDTGVQNRYRPTNPGAQTREAYRGRDGNAGQVRAGSTQRPTNAQVGGGNAQRPSPGQAGGGNAQRPATMDRPGTGANTSTRPGTASSVDRSSGSMTRPTPTYNATQSRPQAQQFSDRGAQSRASVSAPAQRGASGGGAARGGGGGGGGGNMTRGGGGGGGGRR